MLNDLFQTNAQGAMTLLRAEEGNLMHAFALHDGTRVGMTYKGFSMG